jgi:hypothetical protein
MVNATSIATLWNTPQYHGQLLTQASPLTSFLNKIGGIGGGARYRIAKGWEFALNSHNALDASAQKTVTETGSQTAPTARVYDRAQDTQVCQIFHYGVGSTWVAESDKQVLSGIYVAGDLEDVNDPFVSNFNMTMQQAQQDIEFHMLKGLYQKSTDAGVASQMRGIFSRTVQGGGAGVTLTTNDVDAGGDALTVADIDALLLKFKATSFAPTNNMTICGQYASLKKLADLYSVTIMADPNNTIGTAGGQIKTVVTQAGAFPLMEVPQMPALTLGFLDFTKIVPVFLPVPEKAGRPGGMFFYTDLAMSGAADKGQLYGQMSIDLTAEELHGQVWNFI